jgi:hypothetical protein
MNSFVWLLYIVQVLIAGAIGYFIGLLNGFKQGTDKAIDILRHKR